MGAIDRGLHVRAQVLAVRDHEDRLRPGAIGEARIDNDTFATLARDEFKLNPDAKKGTDEAKAVAAMQSGIYWGYVAMIEGLAARVRTEYSADLKVIATGGLAPDLTLLFDLPVANGLRRRQRDAAGQNRLDRETTRFHQRVRSGFLELARKEPRRIKPVNAARTPDRIADDVRTLVFDWLEQHRPHNGWRR